MSGSPMVPVPTTWMMFFFDMDPPRPGCMGRPTGRTSQFLRTAKAREGEKARAAKSSFAALRLSFAVLGGDHQPRITLAL